MKKMLIVAVLLGGCTSSYEYRQVDDSDYDRRIVTTSVTETTTVDDSWIDTAVKTTLVAGYVAIVVLAALR